MAQKNDTPALIGALLITLGLLGGGLWWLTQKSGLNLGGLTQRTSQSGQGSLGNSRPGQNFTDVQNVPVGEFTYGGSTSWVPIRLLDGTIQSARREFRLRYVQPSGTPASSNAGLKMLLNRQVDFAQISRPLTSAEENQAQQLGVTLEAVPVAIDGIAVAVNPSLSIRGLTIEQLKGIYTGQITNWSAVGGANLPIVPISRPKGSGGTIDVFLETVLSGAAFGNSVQYVNTTTQALQRIGSTPGAIYFASAPEVVPQCTIQPIAIGRDASQLISPYAKPFVPASQCPGQRNRMNEQAFQDGSYPLTRNLYVVFKRDGQRSQQAGEAYANLLKTDQGKALLEQAGFVGIQ
ncbi:MAG: PstS family phosphate ABC transporter substrate-binding protein [Synechococcales bacterium]|nr:PstS family phosphate ABC transporter substrate-binding protein [Synechococcales bacterium]